MSDIPAHKELIEESNTRKTFSLLDNFGIITKIREACNIEELSSAVRKSAEKRDW